MKSTPASEWGLDLAQIPVHYETLERGKGISWQCQGRVTAERVKEKKKGGGGGGVQSLEDGVWDEAAKKKGEKQQQQKGKLRRKLLPQLLQRSQVNTLSLQVIWEVLHLQMHAGSLQEERVQRKKRKKEAEI